MSVRAIEAEVSIKSGVQAECTIGRKVIVEVHDDVNLQPLVATENGLYSPEEGVDGYSQVTVNTPVDELQQEIQNAKAISGCDPLTEGITALTTYANEVTGEADTTLSDAVETLASKYGKAEFNPFAQMNSGASVFRYASLPETLVADFEGNTRINALTTMFGNCEGLKNLTIKNLRPSSNIIIETIFGWSSIETVTFENCDFTVKNIQGWVRNSQIRHIYGDIDMSGCTSAQTVFLYSCPNLETISFKKNTINVQLLTLQPCPLSDASYISLGNGLVQGASKSITGVNDQHKTRMNAILGTNDNGTFVADENGNMTLMDFITTVKGWTVT